MEKDLFIRKMPLSLFLFFLSTVVLFGQSDPIKVKGAVRDASTGETLIGVSVLEKGTLNGSVTDIDGNYTLSVAPGNTLVFSYVGFESKEVVVTGEILNVELQLVQELLDEVVVVGYGIQRKSVVTAAISRVTAEELNTAKPSRIEDALKGKVSGVQITQSSGQPGSDSKVRIRGIGTINNSDPLYIVDGMAVDGGIAYLNPVDIESVEILKDAASAAIYGARAANGVILVTTKSGKEGKAKINYNFSYGWQNPWKKKAVLDATEYMTLMNESYINDGNLPIYTKEQIASAGKGTDWQDEIFNYDAPVQNHQLSVSGGNEKANYFVSLGYYDQEGIVGGNFGKSNYNRWSLRTNSSYTVLEDKSRKFLNKVRVGVNISYARSKTTGIDPNTEYGSVLGSAVGFNPTIPVYADEATGEQILKDHPTAIVDRYTGQVFSLPPAGYQELQNPLGMLHRDELTANNDDKFVGSFWGEVDVYEGLKFRSSYGFDLAFWGQDGYVFPYYQSSIRYADKSSVWSEMHRGYKWQVENVLSYDKTFSDVHNLGLVFGQSAQKYQVRNLRGEDFDLMENNGDKANIDSGTADRSEERVTGGTSGYNFTSLASYFGRINYDFAGRYMLQFTLRRDGSSRFGGNNKWGTFPALSLGWNLMSEPYMENVKPSWFDTFKLRFSWGKNGNENIGNFGYANLMNGGNNYYFGTTGEQVYGNMQYGTSPGRIPNPNLRWEESEQIDLGFESRFLGGALRFEFDYYNKKTNGMLMEVQTPSYTGQSAPYGNVGEMENWGIEFEAGWRHSIGDFSYNISANATFMKNKLIRLGNASGEMEIESAGASGLGKFINAKDGYVWPYFYGYKTDGIFQSQAEVDAYVNAEGAKYQASAKPGDVRWVDFDGNGVIDGNDRTKIGKGMPDWSYGFTLGADWKGFDLNLFFQGTTGNDIFDFSHRGDISAVNRAAWFMDRWHGKGTSNKIPRMTNLNPNSNWQSSDLYIKDGSYLRLKTAQIGYTLPRNLVSKASIENLRIYVSAENLLTFTGYDGFDPEIAAGDYNRIGVDRGIYPQSRTISIGANISF